jgi:hypothetical protein
MQLVPGAWSATDTYLTGSVVSYGGQTWTATANVPLDEEPDVASPYWDVYFGSMVVSPYDTTGTQNGTTTYYPGEIVYTLDGSTPTLFMCMVQGNVPLNTTDPPATQDVPGVVDAWNANTYYSQFDTVTGTDSSIYQSTMDLNIGNTAPGAGWEAVPGTQAAQMSGQTWLQLNNCALVQIRLVYPIGSGPQTQSTTKNVYQLPNGYLKQAKQDPRSSAISYIGSPGGFPQDDWVLQGNYLISSEQQVVLYRFAADITYVPAMTEMFCEGLACRLAAEACEPLTQSTEKLQAIEASYRIFMGEARTSNGIETGWEDPPIDDYIACRM